MASEESAKWEVVDPARDYVLRTYFTKPDAELFVRETDESLIVRRRVLYDNRLWLIAR